MARCRLKIRRWIKQAASRRRVGPNMTFAEAASRIWPAWDDRP